MYIIYPIAIPICTYNRYGMISLVCGMGIFYSWSIMGWYWIYHVINKVKNIVNLMWVWNWGIGLHLILWQGPVVGTATKLYRCRDDWGFTGMERIGHVLDALHDFQSLSGWWWLEHDCDFSIYWECHHPIWPSYFSEGEVNHQPVFFRNNFWKVHVSWETR